MAESYKHIFLSGKVIREKYKPRSSQVTEPRIPIRDRISQSQKLLSRFETIWQTETQLHQQREAHQIATREGTYISFISSADHDLVTRSLENLRKGIRLLNIKEIPFQDDHTQIMATVYVPHGKEGYFISKIQDYQQKETLKGNAKNAPLVNSIEDVSIALLESLWTDDIQFIPIETAKWCEVWLNINTKDNKEDEQIANFLNTLKRIDIESKDSSVIFPERAVLLIKANHHQLIELMMQSDLLAEFRLGQVTTGFWMNESSKEQQLWIEDLLSRIEFVDSNIKVCLLDSGVNNGHPLLQPFIDDANTLTVEITWGTDDHLPSGGHGTLMAGIAGYGKLEEALNTTKHITLSHKLCSVKILPRPNQEENREEHWGAITNQAISRAEIQNNEHTLIYCLSVTASKGVNKGRPSSWSGEIDNLAYGEHENKRLIIISAGNINDIEDWQNYPNSNFTSSVQNPAQSWNAIVVGAYTEKINVNDLNYVDYKPVANRGELSPFSSTSFLWENKWPLKPDIVFEGGNLLKSTENNVTQHEDLELLSTSKSFNWIKPFDTINATSAAAAQASWVAAKVAYQYPNAWPETIRGLIIHSANWNTAMLKQMSVKNGNRNSFKNLLSVFGYGIPNIDRALYSQESAFTFIVQESIQPFKYKKGKRSQVETNEIHFFNLPWPSELLLEMGKIDVTLRITLSYFIEPGAGEIGWKDKYRYQSHGLRFDINNVDESEDDFRKRVNIAAREDDDDVNGSSGSERWVIGSRNINRTTGSIHSDYWTGIAADLATCNHIAVYPIIGWWRERYHLGKVENRTRYSLIISLETPVQDVPLYTTVQNIIKVPIEIETT